MLAEDAPLEEREDLPLPRSKLYFPMPSSAKFEEPFVYGSLKHYEEQAMLKGRDVLARSLLEPIPDCAAAWAGEATCAHVLVIFPGAGAWFGVVESTLALSGDEDAGTYLRYIRWARERGLGVAVLNPCLPKYADKERAYALHASRVLPLIAQRWPASRQLLLGYSLGGKYLLESVGREFAGREVRIALIDSVCHEAEHIEQLDPAVEVMHFACVLEHEVSHCRTEYCGTAEHRMAVGTAFPLVTKWLLPDASCVTM
jgi:hypothetical protein